jgi:hypothetical protein
MDVSPVPTAQAGRPFRWWILGAVLVGGLVSLFLCAIVGFGVLTVLGQKVEPTVITASDGQSRVTIPAGWSSQEDLHDEAEIQAANGRQEQYLIVLTENKSDFVDTDLARYAEIVSESLVETAGMNEAPEAKSATINGRPAIQYEISGTVDNLKIVYWLTAVEGTKNYYQVLTWTLASKAEENAPILQQVVESFEEVSK